MKSSDPLLLLDADCRSWLTGLQAQCADGTQSASTNAEEMRMADEVEVVGRELETVFEARDESEAWAVQGMLQSAGIEALVQSLEFPQEIMPGVGSVAVRVPVQQAGEARQIVMSVQNNPPTVGELSESPTKVPSPS